MIHTYYCQELSFIQSSQHFYMAAELCELFATMMVTSWLVDSYFDDSPTDYYAPGPLQQTVHELTIAVFKMNKSTVHFQLVGQLVWSWMSKMSGMEFLSTISSSNTGSHHRHWSWHAMLRAKLLIFDLHYKQGM